ncbi:MAG TPA: FKBP-type peptidyl-prolyl cis-trans isomerase [Opitutaceae bacterium]|nr:FKBP-type peptidyl-prolyl cis-trans isomerase [Opitutaceae bacterium]
MKFRSLVSAGLASFGLLLPAVAQDEIKFNAPGAKGTPATPAQPPAAPAAVPSAAPAAPAAPKIQYTEDQVLQAYGWMMAAQMGLSQLEFSAANVSSMAKGMALAAQGKMLDFDTAAVGPEIRAFLERKNAAFMNKLKQQGLAESAAYFTKLKENKQVQELPSGLRYEILKPGTGAFPKTGQLAKVHYTGSFVNGEVFDSSVQRGQPVELILQEPSPADPRGVITGMAEGMLKINPGGKIKLHIPPHLGYGDEGSPGGIPPAATLVFEVELLEVKDAPKYTPPAPPPGAK